MKIDMDITNFTAGELSPRMKGRVDVAKYYNGVEAMQNFVVMPQGGATARPGTMFAALNQDQAHPARLVPFEFNVQQAYIIELGNFTARFYMNDGLISVAGAPLVLATPWAAADLAALHFTQSADTLYVFHPNYQTRTITRSSNTSWTVTPFVSRDGPYLDVNITSTTLTPSGTSGTITVTASSMTGINGGSGFVASDVGRHLRVKLVANWCWMIIQTVTSSTVITATVQSPVPYGAAFMDGTPWAANTTYDAGAVVINGGVTYVTPAGGCSGGGSGPSGTSNSIADGSIIWQWTTAVPGSTINWQLGNWTVGNYPSCGVFWQNRLMMAGTANQPNLVIASVTGDFTNFAPTANDSVVLATNALSWKISDDQVNAVCWLSPAGSAQSAQLGIGTTGGEEVMQAASTAQALSATSVQVYRETSYGCAANVAPTRIAKSVLFFNRPGRKCHEWTFQWAVNGYVGPDLTVLSEHITNSGVVQVAYQQNPYSVLWCIRADGTLIGLTYLRDQDVVAWHRHQLGGQYFGGPPIVESIACIPSPDGSYDELWLSVLRTVNGTPTRTVEVMTAYFDQGPLDKSFFVDCGLSSTLTYPAASITISGGTAVTTVAAAPSFDGTIALQASAAVFSGGSVGSLVRLNSGTAVIASVIDGQHATATVLIPLSSQAPALQGAWSMTAPIATASGLSYLNGETVQALGDGQVYVPQTVSAGAITLNPPASLVTAGLQYNCVLISMPVAPAGGGAATAAGRIKDVEKLYIRFYASLGGQFGLRTQDGLTNQVSDVLETLLSRSASDAMSRPPALFSGIKRVTPPSGHDAEARIIVQQPEPLPMTVLSVGVRADVSEVVMR